MLVWAIIILENTNRNEALDFERAILWQYFAILLPFSERNLTLFKGNKPRFKQASREETLPEVR